MTDIIQSLVKSADNGISVYHGQDHLGYLPSSLTQQAGQFIQTLTNSSSSQPELTIPGAVDLDLAWAILFDRELPRYLPVAAMDFLHYANPDTYQHLAYYGRYSNECLHRSDYMIECFNYFVQRCSEYNDPTEYDSQVFIHGQPVHPSVLYLMFNELIPRGWKQPPLMLPLNVFESWVVAAWTGETNQLLTLGVDDVVNQTRHPNFRFLDIPVHGRWKIVPTRYFRQAEGFWPNCIYENHGKLAQLVSQHANDSASGLSEAYQSVGMPKITADIYAALEYNSRIW